MNFFEKIPKVELHIHLEGSIPLEALWQLVIKYDAEREVGSFEKLRQKFEYQNFTQFLEVWGWKNRFLREYEDFSFIAEAVAKNLSEQNIRYAEMFFSPSAFHQKGLTTQRITESIVSGFSGVSGIRIALIADLIRDYPPEYEIQTLEQLNEMKSNTVIGIGIGGSEHAFPPEPFENLYKKAREYGFHTTAHAGEAAGPESIWGALKLLGAERIGHGTHAGEDEELLDYIVQRKIPIELCPLSNIKTKSVSDEKSHPVRTYFEKGVRFSINTDDPKMFGNSLAEEYALLENLYGFSKAEIKEVILNAIDTSWLTAQEKNDFRAEFIQDSTWNLI